MAPTETLAEQHFATIQALMPGEAGARRAADRLDPGRRRADLLGKLATGELSLIVGTHALIEDDGPVRAAGGRGRRRAAPLRRPPARRARRQGQRRNEPARAAHDRDADPADAGAEPLRRPRLHGAARAAPRAPAGADVRLLDRARARAGLRADPRGAARRPPGVRRLPAGRGVGAAAGARGDGRVRAAARRASCAILGSCCCTVRCAQRPSRRRWRSSPPAPPTCSSRPR